LQQRLRRGAGRTPWCVPAALALSFAFAPSTADHQNLSGLPLVTRQDPRHAARPAAAEAGRLAYPLPPDRILPADEQLLLPDLKTLPSASVEVRDHPTGRILRFSNTVWNGGEGPLELHGVVDVVTRRTRVVQRAYTAGRETAEWNVGEFVWHPTHTHWHLDRFAIYELWAISDIGEREALVATSTKVSFCLIDTEVADAHNDLRPAAREYTGCGRGRQGLSVGWGDTYRSYLDGQSLPLGTAGDGLYALVSIANPDGRLRESDTRNNTGVAYLAIVGSRVTFVPWLALAKERCLSGGPC
jgi:hypothetical protein